MIKFNPSEKIAVLLLAFGGPNAPSDIEPFIFNIIGKNIPANRMQHIKNRYMAIGGKSPLYDITLKQANLLENILGNNYKVFVGMRYWHPYISDTLKQIKDQGIKQIIALPMTPYNCEISTGKYKIEFKKALKNYGDNFLCSKFITEWNTSPLFIEAIIDTIKNVINNQNISEFQIIFSVHSVPESIIENGDPYLNQINQTINEILKKIGQINWHLGFQSKGGGQGKWLGPDVAEILEKISHLPDKQRNIILAPIGFISDHVETLYDIDIEYKKIAEEKGIKFKRANALNDNPKFIKALAEIIIGDGMKD